MLILASTQYESFKDQVVDKFSSSLIHEEKAQLDRVASKLSDILSFQYVIGIWLLMSEQRCFRKLYYSVRTGLLRMDIAGIDGFEPSSLDTAV